jgi:hypothetical protein
VLLRPIENRTHVHAALASIDQRLSDRGRCEFIGLQQDLMVRGVEVLNDCRGRIAAARKCRREANLELGLGGGLTLAEVGEVALTAATSKPVAINRLIVPPIAVGIATTHIARRTMKGSDFHPDRVRGAC